MRRLWSSLTALLLTAILTLAGCTKPAQQAAEPPGPGAPPPVAPGTTESAATAASPEKLPESAALFPAADWEFTFDIWDSGAAAAVHPVEQWLREPNRLVMASDGKPYATWLFDSAGVWRPDPKGGGALLRYLPPTLKEGETWHQKSGDAEVWFSLSKGGSVCLVSAAHSDTDSCWTLKVLNRGELTTFNFVSNLGPTVAKAANYAEPSASFYKQVKSNQAGRLSAADRKALLDRAPQVSAPKGAVTPATAAEFEAARLNLPGIATARADLNGDGQEETLRGPLKLWTNADIEILDKDGNRMGVSQVWWGQEQRVSVVGFQGASRSYALVQHRGGSDYPTMTIARLTHVSDHWVLDGSYGWDPKSPGTAATRVSVGTDGIVTVEWDMGDPARHTRFRRYRFDPAKFQATLDLETFRQEDLDLRYPADPLDVLQAAFVARWFGLSEELPRYFATREAAAAFQALKAISQPNYGPGSVRFASVTEEGRMCSLKTTPATLNSDGTAPFIATWGGYEWMASVWGQVIFTKGADGRTLIQQVKLEGDCSSSE